MKKYDLVKNKNNANKIECDEHDYLYIKLSGIEDAGNGLYTAIPIYKDEIICYFKGELLSNKELLLRTKQEKDDYFIVMPGGKIMDSMQVNCFAKYANDPKGSFSLYKSNATITLDDNDQVCLVAKKNIKAGEEIFCGYGKRYWENYNRKKQTKLS